MTDRALSKTESIEVRVSSPVKRMLDEAARASDRTVSEFLLDAGIALAAQVLADRHRFVLDEAKWKAFHEVLDRPVQSKPRLKKLLRDSRVMG